MPNSESERIKNNEEKLDRLLKLVNELNNNLNEFEIVKDDIYALNKYYGSKEWFEDKEAFEEGKIKNIKAGVLSEDAVWNLNENIKELLERMDEISGKMFKKRHK